MRRAGVWVCRVLVAAPAIGVALAPMRTVAQEAQPAPATDDDRGKIEELERRIRILERLREIEAEESAKKPADRVTVSAGRDGFSLQSAGGEFQLRLRALAQLDGDFFKGDAAPGSADTFQLARARPIVEATVHRIYDFRIVPDFGLGRTVLQDAYVEARFHRAVRVRAGKFKTPFGLERLQSAQDLALVARALPTNLVPNRDIGIQLHGEAAGSVLAYAAGVFNGVPDGGSADADVADGKDGAARLFVQPFAGGGPTELKGLGIGLAATTGVTHGRPAATGLSAYRTAGKQSFFSFRAGPTPTALDTVVADGRRTRFSPQLYYSAGRFGLMGEYVRSAQRVHIGTDQERLVMESWQATASVMLTRDRASYKGVSPARELDFTAGGAGAFEIVARWGRLGIDGDAYPVFADPDASARSAAERAAGVNWYLSRNVRVMVNYSRSSFRKGAPSGDRPTENVILSRVQIAF